MGNPVIRFVIGCFISCPYLACCINDRYCLFDLDFTLVSAMKLLHGMAISCDPRFYPL
jgi:hypothetical protein